jgi:hypothetical protein
VFDQHPELADYNSQDVEAKLKAEPALATCPANGTTKAA